MTTPADAAATSRYTDTTQIYPASQLEAERAEDRAEFGPSNLWEWAIPPQPVPMGDPIDDVTKPGTT